MPFVSEHPPLSCTLSVLTIPWILIFTPASQARPRKPPGWAHPKHAVRPHHPNQPVVQLGLVPAGAPIQSLHPFASWLQDAKARQHLIVDILNEPDVRSWGWDVMGVRL
eukprot:365151-Chlamydomonas_euryale.AAC.4